MVSLLSTDHRRSSELELLGGLAARDPLALAEAYHRTAGAAASCAARLLGKPDEEEALLRGVYADLWATPPEEGPLEAWVRRRCFTLAAQHLREQGRPPASPSARVLLPELAAPPAGRTRVDAAERLLAQLEDRARCALVRAHDQGVASPEQPDPEAAAALDQALEVLGGPPLPEEDGAAVAPVPRLADWVLGLLEPAAAAELAVAVTQRPDWALRARLLRRGRRRMEGLPPHPDMGHRVLVAVLTDRAVVPDAAGEGERKPRRKRGKRGLGRG